MRLSHMTEAEKRAFVIAPTTAWLEEAGWDRSLLAIEFKTLFEIAPELDLTITGFEFGEIEFIIEDPDNETDARRLRRAARRRASVVTRLGISGSSIVIGCTARMRHSQRPTACSARGRSGANGVHGPALQCADLEATCRVWEHEQHAEFPMASG